MKSLPDPSFFLQLSETFIKTARFARDGERLQLTALREISSAELASQPNPIIQIAGGDSELPVPVATTLSLGETVFKSHAFDQIGFSTLTEFISQGGPAQLNQFELGVFQKENGLPAPTASPKPLELVFCGFNSKIIPELSDAFPNLDVVPTSITLAVLDLFRFIKSQCGDGDRVLLVEIGNEMSHIFLVDQEGLSGIEKVDLGRHSLYEAMAEVLHLHYIGSAIKLFTRSGFDSSDLAPKLGDLFGSAIKAVLEKTAWNPSSVHITGLLNAQLWFADAVKKTLSLPAFEVNPKLLPFDIESSSGKLSPTDTEILAKVFTSLTSDEDFSWHNDYLGCLSKSAMIPRREPTGSNPPFPTAHPERENESLVSHASESAPSEPEASPYAPPPSPQSEPKLQSPSHAQGARPSQGPPSHPRAPVHGSPQPINRSNSDESVSSIPDHLLNDIEEYEGEFEDVDDFGGGTTNLVIKSILIFLCVIIIGAIVTIVFFPKASEKYLGIRPPHINFEDAEPNLNGSSLAGNQGGLTGRAAEVTEEDVASGLKELRTERETMAFGGLYMLTNPTGATVVVGDMAPQLSPIKMPNIAPGEYEITISKDGYETQTITVTIQPKQVLKTETIRLQRVR